MGKVAGALVALVGVLQATLTAVGASNGGLGSVVLNKPDLAWIGLLLVAVAMLMLGIYVIFDPSGSDRKKWRWRALALAGTLAIMGGVGVTGYAALAEPALSGEPKVVASLTWGKPLVLTTTVKANAVTRNDVFHFEVDGLVENKTDHSYMFDAPVLYQAQLGSDGSGIIDSTFTIPIPNHRYEDIGVSAWSGEHPGPCGSLKNAKTTTASGNAKQFSRKGCSVIHVTGLPDP
jgi:hypothetical protein